MPTLNQAAFIGQAVQSVLDQAVPGLELLVADGGSADGTQALLARLAAAHPGQLHWSSAPDSGPADAVNRAVARARGSIIGWLNSDDLYTPGAAARALAHLQQHPQDVLVYGEGEHIAGDGRVLGRYPTRGPHTPLTAWADGCHICQPTAFFRRTMFQSLGGLDATLRTAFDYDFWLRVLKQHPGRVAGLPQVQAQSRLHEGSLTLRLRETVALEALQVVHRHLGPAPAHWLLTHFEEVMAGLPFDGHDEAPAPRLLRLVQRAEAWLAPEAAAALRTHVAQHRALQLATPHLFAAVHADGWAPPVLQLRLRQPTRPYARLRVLGCHAAPQGGSLRLQFQGADGQPQRVDMPVNGPFELVLPIADPRAGAHWQGELRCLNPFVPARVNPGSKDERELAFLLEGLEPA